MRIILVMLIVSAAIFVGEAKRKRKFEGDFEFADEVSVALGLVHPFETLTFFQSPTGLFIHIYSVCLLCIFFLFRDDNRSFVHTIGFAWGQTQVPHSFQWRTLSIFTKRFFIPWNKPDAVRDNRKPNAITFITTFPLFISISTKWNKCLAHTLFFELIRKKPLRAHLSNCLNFGLFWIAAK